MSVNVFSLVFSLVVIGLILLFFFGLFKYVSNGSRHVKNSDAALRRVEEKLDYIIYKMNEKQEDER
uniref:hypothetical protein n=1 Tax=Paenibacillus terrae TaxID=159743 RepID=UPI0011A5DA87|nr:hypothetical protein [Paenibacillus terrae]